MERRWSSDGETMERRWRSDGDAMGSGWMPGAVRNGHSNLRGPRPRSLWILRGDHCLDEGIYSTRILGSQRTGKFTELAMKHR